jgi:hypothetical protein
VLTPLKAPLFARLKIPFVEKVVQGDLFNEDNLLLRQYPSTAVDEAWEALTDVGVVIINEEEVVKLGKDPKKAVKAPPEWGLWSFVAFMIYVLTAALGHGENSYLAQPDGQHALHCLNAIRKYAYREHYYPSQTTSPSSSHSPNLTSTSPLQPFHQAHLSHCLHVLLQTLTCDFSTDMITHNWMETQDYPFPDFAINKKCKDHSEILKWQAKERISVDMWIEMSKRGRQPGEEVLKLPPKLKAWSQSDVAGGQSEKGH